MPASHKWAVICFFFAAGGNIFLNFHGVWDVLGILVTITSLAGFIGILFFRRSPRTYTVGIIGLLFFVLRASQSTLSGLWWVFRGERDMDWRSWFTLGLSCFLYVLILLLFRSYVFGATSRQYYGFPSVPVRRVRIDAFESP